MLSTGQILQSRYQLRNLLGKNAGRQTWLALDLKAQPQEKVILKLLTFGGDVSWEDLKLFEREAQVLKQLEHPCIPKYKDYFAIDDCALWFGLAQEYIDGVSLKEILERGDKFDEDSIKQIATDILEILIYLHELSPPVLHRDIKPSNLILDKRNRVHLVDFGAVQDKASAEGKTFTVVGTYGYAPTEQFGGRAVPASDLYALGATLIHLLTGISPAELPQDNIRIEFKDYTSVSFHLIAWLEKLTEPAVKQRFSTARQALQTLHNSNELDYRQSLSTDKSRASAIGKIPKPSTTKIEVYSNQKYLRIFIPSTFKASLSLARWQLTLAIVYILLGIFSAFFTIQVILGPSFSSSMFIGLVFNGYFILMGLWILTSFKDYVGNIELYLDRQTLKLKRSLFKYNLSYEEGSTRDIEYVSHNTRRVYNNFNALRGNLNPLRSSVTIHTTNRNRKKYLLGKALSEEEAAWLAQEIQDWLKTD